MNITPQVPILSIPTVLNPHTESLRRENNQREIITQPSPTHQSTAEKGVASDKERGRTPAQNNANIDFVSIKEQAELANSSIAGQNQDQNEQQHQHSHNQYSKNQASHDVGEATTNHGSNSINDETSAEALEQEQIIGELKQRDQEVRTHEAAHAAVGGSVTGSPSFTYEQGPNGKRYAVEGEVSVDLSPVSGDARATIEKMQKVHAAALAPVSPSTQDRRIANAATQQILQAQSELLTELSTKQDETQSNSTVRKTQTSSVTQYLSSDKDSENSAAREYDILMNKTLKNQNDIGSYQSDVIVQRALRIENFYANISQAYERAPSNNFELTA